MKLATVVLNLSKEGNHVTRENVTPAELLLLVAEHHPNAGGEPIVSIKETGDTTSIEVEEQVLDEKTKQPMIDQYQRPVTKKTIKKGPGRTADEEKNRLLMRYNAAKVEKLFPGATPNMPTEFDKAVALGKKTMLPTAKLTEVKLI